MNLKKQRLYRSQTDRDVVWTARIIQDTAESLSRLGVGIKLGQGWLWKVRTQVAESGQAGSKLFVKYTLHIRAQCAAAKAVICFLFLEMRVA